MDPSFIAVGCFTTEIKARARAGQNVNMYTLMRRSEECRFELQQNTNNCCPLSRMDDTRLDRTNVPRSVFRTTKDSISTYETYER